MKCSVLIPSYRRGPAVVDCLEAVVGGERLPEQIVIVLRDTDTESHEIVAGWLADSPHAELFEVVDVSERGQIAAMNRGMEVVGGEVVFFTDDDAQPRRDWLERLAAYYDDPEVGGAGGRDVVHHGEVISQCHARVIGEVTCYGRIISNHHCDCDGDARFVEHLKGVNMSFRRELMKPFDSGIRGPHLNDTDQSLTVRGAGYKIVYDPEAAVDHYPLQRPDSPAGRNLMDPRQVYLDAHDHCYVLLKHRPGWQMVLWLPYLTLVGSKQVPGFLMMFYHLARGNLSAPKQFWANMRGVWSALVHRSKAP